MVDRRPLLLLLLAACGDPARRTVDLALAVEAAPASWTTEGVTWTLSEATLEVAALRFREPAPVAWLDLVLPTAHAHPGHAPDAGVVGEWLGPASLDLLQGGALGPATFFEGPVAEGEGELARAHLVGTVALPDRVVDVDFLVDAPQEVLGMHADLEVDADTPPARLVLALDLPGVLAGLDPSTVPAAGPWTLDEPATRNTLIFDLVHGSRWSWKESP